MKTCAACQTPKPTSEFHKRSRAKDGLATWCKECVKAYDIARRQDPAVSERLRVQGREYRLAHKGEIAAAAKRLRERDAENIRAKKRTYYLANRAAIIAKVQQWTIENPERARARRQRYYADHGEKIRAYVRQWNTENPDRRVAARARRRAWQQGDPRTVTARDLTRLLLHYRGACAYCTTPLTAGLHWDHVIPLSRGGRHAIGNLVPACPSCNYDKAARLVVEWRRLRQPRAA